MIRRALLVLISAVLTAAAQEASSGVDVLATISGEAIYAPQLSEAPRNGSSVAGGFRAVIYPTIKLDSHWSLNGALEAITRPWDKQDFELAGNSLRGRVLQANLAYTSVWKNGSLQLRAGQLVSAFGSFLQRYDDADNPLVGLPYAYGYYYNPVTTLGLAGAQADVTLGKWDARLQFANSSPANPRSIFDKDQYANWAGGAGYTIRQGLRVGMSGYRGPYLDRHYAFYFRGEAKPIDLPASAIGVDVDWAAGHWNIRGEWQHFVMPYKLFPDFRQTATYVEARRVLHPRWFVAARAGYVHTSLTSGDDTFEGVIGFRPNTHQIIKTGLVVNHAQDTGVITKALVIQIVTTVHPLSLAWR